MEAKGPSLEAKIRFWNPRRQPNYESSNFNNTNNAFGFKKTPRTEGTKQMFCFRTGLKIRGGQNSWRMTRRVWGAYPWLFAVPNALQLEEKERKGGSEERISSQFGVPNAPQLKKELVRRCYGAALRFDRQRGG